MSTVRSGDVLSGLVSAVVGYVWLPEIDKTDGWGEIDETTGCGEIERTTGVVR